MRSEEAVGVLFVGRVVVLLVSIVTVMAWPGFVGSIALACSLCVSAIFSALFTSGQIALEGETATRALSTHYYMDVVFGVGVVCVGLLAVAPTALIALIVVSMLVKLVKPNLSFPVPRTPLYVLIAIAIVASGAIGVLPWHKGDSASVFVGILAVLIAAGIAARGQLRTTRLLSRHEYAPASAPMP